MKPTSFKTSLRSLISFVAALVMSLAVGRAQDAEFTFTGQHPTEPSNWQKMENWKINGINADRTPGSGLNDNVTITGFAVTNPHDNIKKLTLSGSITGGFLNIASVASLMGGTFNACTVTFLDNSSLTSNGSGANLFNSCVVENRGTFSPLILGLGAFGGQPATVLHNDALTGKIRLGDGAIITMTGGARIDSDGPIEKLAGPGTAAISGGQIEQTGAGSIECGGGTLTVGGGTGGSLVTDRPLLATGAGSILEIAGAATDLRSGANMSGPGLVRILSAFLSGSVNAENIELNDGAILQGSGDLTLLGTFNFRGGTFQGVSTNGVVSITPKLIIQPTGTLQFTNGPGSPTLTRNVVNSGAILARAGAGPGVVPAAAGVPSLENLPGAVIAFSATTGLGGRSINNAGTLIKTNNTDLNSGVVLAGVCTNTGLIDVQTGLLRLSGLQQTAGELRVSSGAEIRFNSGPASLISGGVITGNGTLRDLAVVTLGGTLKPGSSPGTLTLLRNAQTMSFTNATRIEIEIGGTTAGTQYDQLFLSSPFAFPLGGAVDVKFINGFMPSPGQTFSVVRYPNGRTGTFTGFTGLASAPGALLVPRYTSTGLDLVVATNPPVTVVSASPTSFKLNYPTFTGFNFQVEASTNLVNWTSLGSVVAGDGLTKELTDPITGIPARFYRLRLE